MFLRLLILADALIELGNVVIGGSEIGVDRQRIPEFFHGAFVLALLQVGEALLSVDVGGVVAVEFFCRNAGRQQTGEHYRENARPQRHHDTGLPAAARCERRVRSITRPTSCPQAASMSSPRVLRVTVTRPARVTMSRNTLMTSGAEHV